MAHQNRAKTIKAFQDRYDLKLTVEQAEANPGAFKFLNDFLSTQTNFTAKGQKYFSVLMQFLGKHIEDRMNPNFGFYQELNDIDVVEFIQDYESLREAQHYDHTPMEPRKPYLGLDSELFTAVSECLKNLNKPLAKLWSERVMNGQIDYLSLKETTKFAHEKLINSNAPLDRVNEKYLETAVMAHETMKEVRKQRGFGWRIQPWNWRRLYREYKYRNLLASQIAEYKKKNFPVDKITERHTHPAMDMAIKSLEAYKNGQLTEELQAKANEAKMPESSVKSSVVAYVSKITSEPDFKENFINKMLAALPKSNVTDFIKQNTMNMAFDTYFINTIKMHNSNFDEELSEPQKHVAAGAKAIFKNAFIATKMFGYMKPEEHLAAAQIITDMVMKKLSPAAIHPEKYGEYANGYAFKHAEEFNQALGDGNKISDNSVNEVFSNASKLYGELTREIVPLPDLDNVQNVIVSQPLNQPSSKAAPMINKQ